MRADHALLVTDHDAPLTQPHETGLKSASPPRASPAGRSARSPRSASGQRRRQPATSFKQGRARGFRSTRPSSAHASSPIGPSAPACSRNVDGGNSSGQYAAAGRPRQALSESYRRRQSSDAALVAAVKSPPTAANGGGDHESGGREAAIRTPRCRLPADGIQYDDRTRVGRSDDAGRRRASEARRLSPSALTAAIGSSFTRTAARRSAGRTRKQAAPRGGRGGAVDRREKVAVLLAGGPDGDARRELRRRRLPVPPSPEQQRHLRQPCRRVPGDAGAWRCRAHRSR